MRRLKHKHTRRTVKFYKIVHGFREPFKVLLDGNFLKAVLDTSIGTPKELLTKLLGGPVKVYTTRCILREIKGLGRTFSDTYRTAREAMHMTCPHSPSPVAAAACIRDCVGAANTEHFFVATQDRGLRAALGKLEGGASIFVTVNGLQLEPPSERQRQSAKEDEADRMGVGEHELAASALAALPNLQPKDDGARAFRRRGAKGPNPLSVKKKKTKLPGVETSQLDGQLPGRRRRVRARPRVGLERTKPSKE